MKKYFVLILFALSFIYSTTTQAQSEVFAAGEIYSIYAGDSTELCGDSVPVNFIFKFYRDPGGPAFPPDPAKTISYRLPGDMGPGTDIILDSIWQVNPAVPTNCLNPPSVDTEYQWYINREPVMIPGNTDIYVYYGDFNAALGLIGRDLRSPENNNINAGQQFFIETSFSTRCGVVYTGDFDNPPNKAVSYNLAYTSGADWSNEAVESFCNGQEYRYNFEQFIINHDRFYRNDTLLLPDTTNKLTITDIPNGWVIDPDQSFIRVYTRMEPNPLGPPNLPIRKSRHIVVRGDTLITATSQVRPGSRIVREDEISVLSHDTVGQQVQASYRIFRRDSIFNGSDTLVDLKIIIRDEASTLVDIDVVQDTVFRLFQVFQNEVINGAPPINKIFERQTVTRLGEIIDEQDPNRDLLEILIRRPLESFNNPADFSSGQFTTTAPFPLAPFGGFDNGILTFIPDLAPGELTFVAAINVRSEQKRIIPQLLPDGSGNLVMASTSASLGIDNREMRWVIGTSCRNTTPNFTSTEVFFRDPTNPADSGWNFDCLPAELYFEMSEPMLFNSVDTSLRGAGEEIVISRGPDPNINLDDNTYKAFVRVDPANITPTGEFTQFTLQMQTPLPVGDYTLLARIGVKDGDTWVNRCGYEFNNFDSLSSIHVDTNYIYEYYTDIEYFCFPDTPMVMDALKSVDTDIYVPCGSTPIPGCIVRSEFAFKGPNVLATDRHRDVVFTPDHSLAIDKYYTVPPDYPNSAIMDFPEGFWSVGIGLDASYTYNGQRFQQECYDEDEDVFARFLVAPDVTLPDIDLCAHEDWPLVTPGIDYTASSLVLDNIDWKLRDESLLPIDSLRPIGGQSNDNTVNDTLNMDDGVAFGIGSSRVFTVQSTLFFKDPNGGPGCGITKTFDAVRQDIEVEIGNDTAICEDNKFLMMNTTDTTYLVPDSMFYQWYYGPDMANTPIPGADSNSAMIEDQGWYRLEVTKRTKESFCTESDSIFVLIADNLEKPKPICSQITFQDGVIRQTFYTPPVPGADFFQVRGIDRNGNYLGGWEDAVGLVHEIDGEQVKLEVRGVNSEVGELAPCKYGPSDTAEACEALIKPVNIFTPNGDGINDFLRFDLIELYPGSALQIFNRWGRLIYEDGNYRNDWDGEDHKDGTYFYILRINDPEGRQELLRGNFTIVR